MKKTIFLLLSLTPTILFGQVTKQNTHIDGADSNNKFRIIKGSDTIISSLDQPPVYKGGQDKIYHYIAMDIKYPDSAKDLNIMGTVYIMFTIDKNGKVHNHKIFKSVYPCLDREALRVVKDIPNNWTPGVLNGEKVDVVYILPIHFVLR